MDIEGIAADGEQIYLGFRGPVLRENYVPIMVTTFDNPQDYELRFVRMGGRGVRDITKVEDGFLIIGGPVEDGDSSYELYFWDGANKISGNGKEYPELESLGQIKTADAKAEGITVIEETKTDYLAIIVFDSLKNGKPSLYRIGKKA